MSTPSETVKAAQRLLADREVVGLAKYGMTVDRTDLQAGDWLQHAIEEASDMLLYLIRLRETMPVTVREVIGELARQSPQPSPAEDPERAAYLRRWEGAPAQAGWLTENSDGNCCWWDMTPWPMRWPVGYWNAPLEAVVWNAFPGLLGSVRCEPRPEPRPGVEG